MSVAVILKLQIWTDVMPGISTQSFELTGGRLCLDFANTVDDRPTNHPKDRLHGYEDFIGFGMQTGILSRAEVRELTGMVKRHRRTGARLYREEIALRETIFRIFAAAANNRRPTLKDLLALNHVAHLLGRCALVLPKNGRYAWTWKDGRNAGDRLVWEIVRS